MGKWTPTPPPSKSWHAPCSSSVGCSTSIPLLFDFRKNHNTKHTIPKSLTDQALSPIPALPPADTKRTQLSKVSGTPLARGVQYTVLFLQNCPRKNSEAVLNAFNGVWNGCRYTVLRGRKTVVTISFLGRLFPENEAKRD